MKVAEIVLYYQRGTSDKVYVISAHTEGSGYEVKASWGKRSTWRLGGFLPSKVYRRVQRREQVDSAMVDTAEPKIEKGYTTDSDGRTTISKWEVRSQIRSFDVAASPPDVGLSDAEIAHINGWGGQVTRTKISQNLTEQRLAELMEREKSGELLVPSRRRLLEL